MIFNKLAIFAKDTAGVVVSKAKAVAMGSLYTEQVVDKQERFFNAFGNLDTDEVLSKAGIERHQLESLLNDDEIDGYIDRRLESLTQAKYTLNPSEGEVAEFIYEVLDKHKDAVLKASLNSKLYGYSVTELIWTSTVADKLERVLVDIGSGETEVQYYLDNKRVSDEQRLALCQQGLKYPEFVSEKPIQWFEPKNNGGLLWRPNDYSQARYVDLKTKFLLQRYHPTYSNPRGKAILSRVYWLWYFKTNGWRFWSKFLERFGSPLLVGTTKGDVNLLANAMAAAHNQSIVAVPDDDKVEAIAAAGNGESFNTYCTTASKRIAIYLVGQTLTSGTDAGGTYGQGKVHQEQQQIIFDSDKNHGTVAVQWLIDVVCKINGFEPPEFEFTSDKGLQLERADRDVKLTAMGVSFTKDYYADSYDIDEKYIVDVTPTQQTAFSKLGADKLQFAQRADINAPVFTDEQQQLEQLADDTLEASVSPLDYAKLVDVITGADSVESMQSALFDMVGEGMTDSAFRQLCESAVMVAELHGFVDETVQSREG